MNDLVDKKLSQRLTGWIIPCQTTRNQLASYAPMLKYVYVNMYLCVCMCVCMRVCVCVCVCECVCTSAHKIP